MLAWYPKEMEPQLRRYLDAYAAVKPHAYVPTVTHQSGSAALQQDVGERSGKIVAELENVSKAYGDNILIRDFSTRILRGDRIGLIGKLKKAQWT